MSPITSAGVSAFGGTGLRRRWGVSAALLLVTGATVWVAAQGARETPALALTVEVVTRHPHDRQAFTQGLLLHEGALYESTGQYGESSLRKVERATGRVLRRRDLPGDVFAEGLARVGDRLFQLSWREGKAFVWDLQTFEPVAEHSYPGEGWGLCFDGERLVMSTGSDRLVFRDPNSFRKLGEVRVVRDARPLRKLNELACVDGAVFANVWEEETIVKIDPDSGRVLASIDASGLLPAEDRHGGEDVLNGIAYLPASGTFLLTGKYWPYLYEVRLVERP